MAKERLVIVDGDAAGMSAASHAKRMRPEREVTAFEKSPHTSLGYAPPPFSPVWDPLQTAARVLEKNI